MNKFLIGTAALAIAGAAFAQGMQPPAVQPPMNMPAHDMNGDRVQTRAEVIAKAQKHFAMIDANHDGFVTADELQSMGGGRQMGGHAGKHGDMAMNDGPMDKPEAMFDRLDANHDGTISRDEFAKGRQLRIERKVVVNGAPDQDGAGHGDMNGGGHGMRGGGMGERMLKMADTNHDGRISLQELTAASLQRFDRADANHDGKITPDERMAARQQMKQQRGQTL